MQQTGTDNRTLPQYRDTLTCEACGTNFSCGAGTGTCWCGEIKLDETTREFLRARYSSCLCRTCLEGYAEAEKNNDQKAEQVLTGSTN